MVMARRWGRKFSSQFSVLGLELRTSDSRLKSRTSARLYSHQNRFRSNRFLLLDQIPEVAIEVGEDCDGSVHFFFGVADELYVARLECAVVTPEVVGVEEEENTASGLVADAAGLLGRCGLG